MFVCTLKSMVRRLDHGLQEFVSCPPLAIIGKLFGRDKSRVPVGFYAGLLLFVAAANGYGNGLADFYTARTRNLAEQSYSRWQAVSAGAARQFNSNRPVNIKSSGGTKAAAAKRKKALNDYLTDLVPVMAPSPNVAHIPAEHPVEVDTTDPERKWTKYYARAKKSLRPYIEYTWSSNASNQRTPITLSEEHIETLQENFDVLIWYRDQLELRCAGSTHLGGQQFKLFLDYFVADLLDGLPTAPTINMATGKVDGGEWELDERNLRQQLIMAYRYLIAKYQIYTEYEEFGPADRELLVSMMKISFLMGAHMRPDWIQEMDVNLDGGNRSERWKRPMREALEVLQGKVAESDMPDDELLQSPLRYEEPCVITIPPPKAKEKIKPTAPEPEVGQKIEITIRQKP